MLYCVAETVGPNKQYVQGSNKRRIHGDTSSIYNAGGPYWEAAVGILLLEISLSGNRDGAVVRALASH